MWVLSGGEDQVPKLLYFYFIFYISLAPVSESLHWISNNELTSYVISIDLELQLWLELILNQSFSKTGEKNNKTCSFLKLIFLSSAPRDVKEMVEIEMLKTQHFILYKFYTMEIRILYYGNVFWFALEGFFFSIFSPNL